MKKLLQFWMTIVLTAFIGLANASTTNWYGYALYTSNSANWQNHFVGFNTQDLNEVQTVSGQLPAVWAATYWDGYVWFVTQTRSLCKAPFDAETHTIGDIETLVPTLEQYNLYIGMSYNPIDGMMYYLCQDSQYTMYLKRSDLATPSVIEVVGNFNVRMWTLAINAQGRAYGISYEGGNLYEIDLNTAATTLVGSTGKEVWYTQSMAFDLDTGELYWAQFATVDDHGLYQVNTETAEVTPLGDIGQGTQLAGLFMIPQPTPPEPEIINEIFVEGFTEPVWGAHPDFDLEMASDAHYSISEVKWYRVDSNINEFMEEEDLFDHEDAAYYLSITFEPEEGCVFAEDVAVYCNGDPSIIDASESYFVENGAFMAFTKGYYVIDPSGIDEQTLENVALWPNPVVNVLYIDCMDGAVVSVFDMTGRMVMKEHYEGKLDVSQLVPGLYTILFGDYKARFVKE